jgi:membrane dipeptidase
MERETSVYPIIDGHVDVVYQMMSEERDIPFREINDGPVTPDKLEAGDVRVLTIALYCPDSQNGPGAAEAYLKRLLNLAESHLAPLTHIKTAHDLSSSYQNRENRGYVLLLENADALIDFSLDRLLDAGLKVVGLTHVGRNRIGDGNCVSYPGRLTGEGIELVKALDESGFALDVAHLSPPCFRHVLDLFHGPLITSHTGFRFFCDKARNLDEDQLRHIFERGGMVGIAADPEMLSTSNTAGIEDTFKHIDWVVQKFGPRHVGLGSDFCGFGRINRGLEDISHLQDLTASFHDHGYPEDAIEQIMGRNWYEFYSALLAA